MRTPLESTFWENVYTKKYPSVQVLIETYPEANLINAIDEDTKFNLPLYLIQATMNPREVKPLALLDYVLKHPTMNWVYASNSGLTAAQFILDAAKVDGDFSVIKSLKETQGFMLSNNKLTYTLAVDMLKKAESTHKESIERKRPQPRIDEALVKVQKCKAILALVRDITILHAIKTDNPDLFEHMAQAGGQPLENLGDFGKKEIPSFLFGVNQPNPKLKAWQSAVFDRKHANRDQEVSELTLHLQRHGLFQTQVAQINAQHDARAVAILGKAGADRQDRIEAALVQMS